MAEKENSGEIFTEDQDTVTLNLDDGRVIECIVLAVFEAGGRDYAALLPEEQKQDEEGHVFLYRYVKGGDGEPDVEYIDSDEEYRIAANQFNELINSYGYEDVVDEDELKNL